MIRLQNLTLQRGPQRLLEGAELTLHAGQKAGLIGANGAGKSSLFALLRGEIGPDSGDCSLPPDWRIAHMRQEVDTLDRLAVDYVLDGDVHLRQVQRDLQTAEAAHDGAAIARLHSDLDSADGYTADARARKLLAGLGFTAEQMDKRVGDFSGGWRMRLNLAQALMCPSDLLLLDEPTNHLDLDALVWLEAWLKRYTGTLLVISHDREFLDAITDVTLHIDNAKLTRYGGNYSTFEDTRALQMELQQNAYAKQQDKIAHLQKFIARFKAKASKAKQAQSRVKALDRMEKIAPVLASADFTFEFKEPANLPNPMLAMDSACFGYPPPADAPAGTPPTVIVRGVSKSVMAGQRIGILGANGQGKSTLVKTIARTLAPISGDVVEGKGLNIGYFAQQELDVLRPLDNPLEHMVRMAREGGVPAGQSGREQDLRTFLGTFNFSGDMVKQPVGTMSGGEKARLVLCMIVWQRPNLLLLDEPTNHLDLATREALAMALNEFEGTVMLVSHDRSLLRSVCDEFWLVSHGGIEPFDGDLDDYQRYLLDEAKRVRESVKASQKAAKEAAPVVAAPVVKKDSAELKALRRDLGRLEQTILELQTRKHGLEARLASTQSAQEIGEIGVQVQALTDELAGHEDRWLDLSERIEAASA